MSFLISNAVAAGVGTAPAAAPLNPLFLLIGFAVIFYFLILRPQTKRQKEQRALLAGLAKGDEVVTTGGIIGKIVKVADNHIVLSVTPQCEIRLQKQAVVSLLPKGSIKTLD